MREVMDPNVILAGGKEYATCGNEECDYLILGWLGLDVSKLGVPRDVVKASVDGDAMSCVPLVVPSESDAFCAVCGVFVMHGVSCRDTYHAGLGEPHPDFADLI